MSPGIKVLSLVPYLLLINEVGIFYFLRLFLDEIFFGGHGSEIAVFLIWCMQGNMTCPDYIYTAAFKGKKTTQFVILWGSYNNVP